MHNRASLSLAVAVFLVPLLAAPAAQQAPQGAGSARAGQGRVADRRLAELAEDAQQGRRVRRRASPRARVQLNEKGVWIGGGGVGGRGTDVPYQEWARAVAADRRVNELEPHTRCKASGFQRQFLTPYGAEITEIPELQRVYIFDIGGPHTFRTIYTDGRSHPKNLEPSLLRPFDRLVGRRHARR